MLCGLTVRSCPGPGYPAALLAASLRASLPVPLCPCPACVLDTAWPCLTGPVACPAALLAPVLLNGAGVFPALFLALLTGVSSFVCLALTHGLLCSLHGVLLVLCCSYGLELLPCHCLLPCLLHSGIKARMHRAFIFLKKIPENIFRVIPPGVTFSRIFSWPFSEPDASGKLPCSHLRYPGLHPAAGDS